MATDHIDPEKGMSTSTTLRPLSTPTASTVSPEGARNSFLQAQTPLQLFQCLVGINTPRSITHDDSGTAHSRRSHQDDNVGLHQRAKNEERKARISYILTSYISNTLYMLQILLAATFTALSAYKDSNVVVVTVLGALNTVIAGSLAWQKGQGVPQRYRKAQDQYAALIVEIEMAERSFLESSAPDPRAEQARLYKLYETAKADQQANYPDLYVSTGAMVAGAGAGGGKDVAKEVEEAKVEAEKARKEMLGRIEELVAQLEGRILTKVEGAVQGVMTR